LSVRRVAGNRFVKFGGASVLEVVEDNMGNTYRAVDLFCDASLVIFGMDCCWMPAS